MVCEARTDLRELSDLGLEVRDSLEECIRHRFHVEGRVGAGRPQ